MEIRLHPAAINDIETALDHYADIDVKLAFGLLKEWETGLERICQAPLAWSPIHKECRRYLLSLFPYAVIFRVKDTVIEIMAFMHLKRKPDVWEERAKP